VERRQMNAQKLIEIAMARVSDDKGLPAMDERG
jgi:hypothetical protein